VQTLQFQSRGFGRGFGRRGGAPGGAPSGDNAQEQSEVAKAMTALRETLEDTKSTPEVIKTKLDALRAARAKSAAELATAQKELRELLSVKQEAFLVMSGMLD